MAPADMHTFASDVTEAERDAVNAALQKAVGDKLTLPTPIYKEIPKGHKKDNYLCCLLWQKDNLCFL